MRKFEIACKILETHYLSFDDRQLLIMELLKIDDMSLLHEGKVELYLDYLYEQPITKYRFLTGADQAYQRSYKQCISGCSKVSRLLNTKCKMNCKSEAAGDAIIYLNSKSKACEALNDPEPCKEYVDRLVSRYEGNINKLRAKISYLET